MLRAGCWRRHIRMKFRAPPRHWREIFALPPSGGTVGSAAKRRNALRLLRPTRLDCLTQETQATLRSADGRRQLGETSAGSACRGNRAMAKTYRDVAIEQMILTVKEAMRRTIDCWGSYRHP